MLPSRPLLAVLIVAALPSSLSRYRSGKRRFPEVLTPSDLLRALRITAKGYWEGAEDKSPFVVERIADMGEDRDSEGRKDSAGQSQPREEPNARI